MLFSWYLAGYVILHHLCLHSCFLGYKMGISYLLFLSHYFMEILMFWIFWRNFQHFLSYLKYLFSFFFMYILRLPPFEKSTSCWSYGKKKDVCWADLTGAEVNSVKCTMLRHHVLTLFPHGTIFYVVGWNVIYSAAPIGCQS